jgi:SAM-dependent methyltransferase
MHVRAVTPLIEEELDCRVLRKVPARIVQDAYRREFGYDSEREFAGVDEILLLECPVTQLKFFYPPTLAGHEELYRRLETFPWNYKNQKWEHDVAFGELQQGVQILDVGCGRGAFLERCTVHFGATTTGLEFNESAAAFGRERGINILTESIDEHLEDHSAHYDIVTSFQVLEHVATPAPFLRSCIKLLRPGGTLMLGVPNNDSFLGVAEQNWLNMPPHHMTLWTRSSLEYLPQLLELRHVWTRSEPLKEIEWYQSVYERRHLKGRLHRFLYYHLRFNDFFTSYLNEVAEVLPGHTILAKFIKA